MALKFDKDSLTFSGVAAKDKPKKEKSKTDLPIDDNTVIEHNAFENTEEFDEILSEMEDNDIDFEDHFDVG